MFRTVMPFSIVFLHESVDFLDHFLLFDALEGPTSAKLSINLINNGKSLYEPFKINVQNVEIVEFLLQHVK